MVLRSVSEPTEDDECHQRIHEKLFDGERLVGCQRMRHTSEAIIVKSLSNLKLLAFFRNNSKPLEYSLKYQEYPNLCLGLLVKSTYSAHSDTCFILLPKTRRSTMIVAKVVKTIDTTIETTAD